MAEQTDNRLIALTADIVAAHVAHNRVAMNELPELIGKVHGALGGLGAPVEEPARQQAPAVSIRASIRPDYIVCLEDGKKLTMLKRYLRTNYDMSPEEYRAKWKLPADYPMVAPAYAEKRRHLAHAIGLGRKREAGSAPVQEAPAVKPARRRRAKPVEA
ncbi:transcriptional regulator [Sphingomonas oleivorans]|uniref:Transcriptional regulator n=1 Tax=Sphingomonas oleivorans TaxID=1735121 RepID=A0A2T5G2N6_9SPHN|nr:MucR family transcriptional regulator [Sphingomonas oleivorans]PTQ13371.1 transcriptional regulator [Sphingomonas oleivorans]